jgi:hypothetical protein
VIGSLHSRVTLLLAPAVVVFAGCAGASNASHSHAASNTASNSSHPEQSGPTQQSRSQVAADRALGDRALLHLADFPTGWTVSARRNEKKQPKLEQQLAACLHVAPSLVNESDPAEVRSPDFKQPRGAEISNTVTVTPTPDVAAKQFTVFTEAQTAPCLRNAIQQELRSTLSHPEAGQKIPAGVSFGQATVEQMSFTSVGDQSIAYRVSLSLSAKTLHLPLYFDAVLIRVGRADTALSFTSVLLPTSPSTELALTDLTVRRLNVALGTRSRTFPETARGTHEGPV